MQLGTGLFTCQQRPGDDRPMAALYDEMVDLAVEAEAAGLDSVWVSEHHFLDDGYLSGTMPSLGGLATATEDIEIGSCIALAPLYDPVRLAEDAATVDLLSDGRLTLGLAIGSNPTEFEQFGVDPEERVEHLEDAMQMCRAAWSAGPLDYDSPFHPVSPDVSVTPKPDGEIPLMLGGAARPAVRRAAREAEAWCAPSSLSVEGVRKRVADIRKVREKEDIEGDFTVYVLQHGFVADSTEEAWDAMSDGYLWLQRRYQEIFSGESVEELDDEKRAELKAQAIFGTADEVVDQLSTYREALEPEAPGDVHFVFRTYHPGTDADLMADCIGRLGADVAPHLD
jgi:alkanesulfonate monooxygenase SsuD/methylene tetrahydromethanopterin reductase-like flavin-dependent oxidoreductase (luciferase family)